MQQIHINRNRINGISFEIPEIQLPLKPGDERSFEITIINHGHPTHVHLSTSDNLRKHIRFLQDNPYVANENLIPVVVRLPSDLSSIQGEIKVTTGYGSVTEGFKVLIGEQSAVSEARQVVDVDERLGTPRYRQTSTVEPHQNVEVRRSKKQEIKAPTTNVSEKLILPLFMVVAVMLVLFITFIYEKVDVFYGAITVSIIIIILMVYGIMHLLSKK